VSVEPEMVETAPAIGDRPFGPTSRLRRRTRTPRPIHHYSRFVAWMKVALPTIAIGLLLLIAIWPRIQSAVERLKKIPRIDFSQARDLRMVNVHYSGVDRHDRPFTVTADTARQRPEIDDLVELEAPKADLTTQSGTWIALNAYSGVYQPQAQLLDLFGDVELFQDKGNEFHTDSAHIDMGKGTAEGSDPVQGHGPFGTIEAEGFRVESEGDVIVFTGKTKMLLERHDTTEQP
jgi:lipopolysaccharide export system protein LptC